MMHRSYLILFLGLSAVCHGESGRDAWLESECSPVFLSHCSDLPAGGGRIKKCVVENIQEASPSCVNELNELNELNALNGNPPIEVPTEPPPTPPTSPSLENFNPYDNYNTLRSLTNEYNGLAF